VSIVAKSADDQQPDDVPSEKAENAVLDLNVQSLQQRRSVILNTVASVLLFAFATSSLAAEVPGDLLGTWSSDSVCNLNANPSEAFIYTFGPKYISYYEIECLIQDVKPGLDKVDFNLDCFKGGGFRYFDKLRIQRPSSDKLSLTFKFPGQGKHRHSICV
jgi:hypothetical protein